MRALVRFLRADAHFFYAHATALCGTSRYTNRT